MNKAERLKVMASVDTADSFDAEQAAMAGARVVDIRPSLPAGAADLYAQWEPKDDSEAWTDYVTVCKALGAGWDRGARRYVIHAKDAEKYHAALTAEGFAVAMSMAGGADTFNFSTSSAGSVFYIDTERSKQDHARSWLRTMRRA